MKQASELADLPTSQLVSHLSLRKALRLWLVCGIVGGHRFYAGRSVTGILQVGTLGGCGVWWLFDLVTLCGGRLLDAHQRPLAHWSGFDPYDATDDIPEIRCGDLELYESVSQEQEKKLSRQQWIAFVLVIPFSIAFAAMTGSKAAGVPIFFASAFALRRARGRSLLLWLRKFGRMEPREVALHRAMESGSRGLAVPVTLQDDEFKYSFQLAASQPIRCTLAQLLAIGVTLGSAAVMLMPVLPLVKNASARAAIFLIAGGVSVWIGWKVFWWLIARLGVKRLDQTGAAAADKIISKVRRGRGLYGGVSVLAYEGEDWVAVIKRFLQASDIVLLDISEISPAVRQEMALLKDLVPSSRVVLASLKLDDASVRRARDSEAEQALGDAYFRECRRIDYGEVAGSAWRRWQLRRFWMSRLSLQINALVVDAIAIRRLEQGHVAAAETPNKLLLESPRSSTGSSRSRLTLVAIATVVVLAAAMTAHATADIVSAVSDVSLALATAALFCSVGLLGVAMFRLFARPQARRDAALAAAITVGGVILSAFFVAWLEGKFP